MLERRDMYGVFVPVVTPFLQNEELDLESYRSYVGGLIQQDIQGLIINGTTGEAPTVAWEEVLQLVHATKQLIGDKKQHMPVIVGTGTNDTLSTVRRTASAAESGADAVLVVVPYYSRPSQEGIVKHFQKVAEVGVPVIVYEVPYRTGVQLTMDTARRIMDINGVIGLKDSSDSLELLSELNRHGAGPVLCGDDINYYAKLEQGAAGGILASANVNTQVFIDVYRLVQGGDDLPAKHFFEQQIPLIHKLFQESNPAPLKWILSRKGVIASDQLRLPMTPVSKELEDELEQLLPHFEVN